MKLPADLQARYAPGGDLFNTLVEQYGNQAAQDAYAASLWGDRADVATALLKYRSAKYKTPVGSTSTLGNFWNQITTDPLAAPLDSANRQIGNVVWNVVKNPFVLIVVGLLVWGWLGFPGAPRLAKKFA